MSRKPRSGATGTAIATAVVPAASPVFLDAQTLNVRLLAGGQLSISESGGEVARCNVVPTDERVPPDLFDDYLARGLIQEMENSFRFGISNDGRKRLR